MRLRRYRPAALACAVVLSGCAVELEPASFDGGQTSIEVQFQPEIAPTGFNVLAYVEARNPRDILTKISLSFDDGRTWSSRSQSPSNFIQGGFQHAYGTDGDHVVQVAVKHTGGAVKMASFHVRSATPARLGVWAMVRGTPTPQSGNSCYAVGPPAAAAGADLYLLDFEIPYAVGTFNRSTPVTVTQSFRQSPPSPGGANYACHFTMSLVAGPESPDRTVAAGSCDTDSAGALECSIALSGVVP